MCHDGHRWDVVRAVRQNVALLVTVEPVEGAATPRHVVGPPTSLISDPCRNGDVLLQPVTHRPGGKVALVPVGYRGAEGEGVADEPREVQFWWILHCCSYSDVKVYNPV